MTNPSFIKFKVDVFKIFSSISRGKETECYYKVTVKFIYRYHATKMLITFRYTAPF